MHYNAADVITTLSAVAGDIVAVVVSFTVHPFIIFTYCD